jgi:type I restriction enzyme S subunit
MTWRNTALRELFTVKHGYAFQGEFFDSAGEYVLLTPGNFREEGGFRDQIDKRKYYTGEIPDDFVLKRDDLLVVMTEQAPGLLGSSAWIPESGRFLHNQRLGLITQVKDLLIDKKFLYYLFNTVGVRHQISSSASGTKVRHTSPERIGRVTVALPPIVTQRRIAAILSAYDDLIENNRRRIQLLEQAARLIYQEWFVRLRFPGHERVGVVDGVPERWEKRKLGDILILNYGKGLKESERIEGDVPVYGSSGVVGSHNQHLVEGPGIIVGRKGNVGSVFWSQSAFFPIDTVYYVDAKTSSLYLFHFLQSLPFQSSDGAVPGLNRNYAYSLPVRVPSPGLVARFEGIAGPIYQQILNLQRQNERLRQARDLLLPKLMSGEIAV